MMIDNQFLGWLSAASGHSPRDVLYNLYDMSTPLIERMNERDTQRARAYEKYKDSNIEIGVIASTIFEWNKWNNDDNDWYHTPHTQRPLHPPSREDPKYNWIRITVKLKPSQSKVISREEIETMMLEQFLLGAEDEGEASVGV